ncbi:hypothetical protein PG993_000177 [Apiospora rasikravindrae]|uniref:Uncharacterized protein n=1 Tax=Apiospora rasikravindrae TaxID=990691 RepID=A0ABR1UA28_9PEZI
MASRSLLETCFVMLAATATAAPLTRVMPEQPSAMAVRAVLVASDDQAGYLVPGKQADAEAVVAPIVSSSSSSDRGDPASKEIAKGATGGSNMPYVYEVYFVN